MDNNMAFTDDDETYDSSTTEREADSIHIRYHKHEMDRLLREFELQKLALKRELATFKLERMHLESSSNTRLQVASSPIETQLIRERMARLDCESRLQDELSEKVILKSSLLKTESARDDLEREVEKLGCEVEQLKIKQKEAAVSTKSARDGSECVADKLKIKHKEAAVSIKSARDGSECVADKLKIKHEEAFASTPKRHRRVDFELDLCATQGVRRIESVVLVRLKGTRGVYIIREQCYVLVQELIKIRFAVTEFVGWFLTDSSMEDFNYFKNKTWVDNLDVMIYFDQIKMEYSYPFVYDSLKRNIYHFLSSLGAIEADASILQKILNNEELLFQSDTKKCDAEINEQFLLVRLYKEIFEFYSNSNKF